MAAVGKCYQYLSLTL